MERPSSCDRTSGFAQRTVPICLLLIFLAILAPGWSGAETRSGIGEAAPAQADGELSAAAPVMVAGRTVFEVKARLFSFSPAERAQIIATRVEQLLADPLYTPGAIKQVEAENSTDLVVGDRIIMTVTDADGFAAGKKRQTLAGDYARAINDFIVEHKQDYTTEALLLGGAYALAALAGFVLVLMVIKRLFTGIGDRLRRWQGNRIRGIKIQNLEVINADRMTEFFIKVARFCRFALTAIIVYLFVPLILGFFPWTRPLSQSIVGYVLSPLRAVGWAVLAYIPKLLFAVVILFVAKYALKLIALIFQAIEQGNINFPNFHADWAQPTYKICRFLVIVFTAVVIFPYLPGSESPAFKGISLFIGVLLSLGSTAAVGNVVAGIILTYMRAFVVGDRVKISDTIGDITEKDLLVTRVRTIKNEDITIPNSMVLGSHIINYSSSARERGLILNTTVTIGYDAPWRQVHELLLAAARATPDILGEPGPFILQTSLDDFYVTYQLNAYTDKPNRMASIYSTLHQNIQDNFNAAGVEIMSPHYSALRDGNRITVPEENLADSYVAPSFRFQGLGQSK